MLENAGCGFPAMQGEICVCPGVTASDACPRKGAFSVSLTSATENCVMRRTIFHPFFPFVLSMPVLHPCGVSGDPLWEHWGHSPEWGPVLGGRRCVAYEGQRNNNKVSGVKMTPRC